MSVSVKVYYGRTSGSAHEIRRFIFKPEHGPKISAASAPGIYAALIDRIQMLFSGLNLSNVHLCWKDDDGDYVVFSSDDELKVAINSTTDNTLRIYIREKDSQVKKQLSTNASCIQRPTNDLAPIITKKHYGARSKERASTSHYHHAQQQAGSQNLNVKHSREADFCENDMINRLGLIDDVSLTKNDARNSEYRTTNSRPQNDGVRENLPSSSSSASPSPPVTVINRLLTPIPTISGRTCHECQGSSRRGVWYSCTVCTDYFLCTECENQGLHDKHSMMRTTTTTTGASSTESLPNGDG